MSGVRFLLGKDLRILRRSPLLVALLVMARFADAAAIVEALTERALLVDGHPTGDGRELVSTVLAASETSSGAVWRDLPTGDVEAAKLLAGIAQVHCFTRTARSPCGCQAEAGTAVSQGDFGFHRRAAIKHSGKTIHTGNA